MRVECEVEHVTLDGDYTDRAGNPVQVDGVRAICGRCGHVTESFGTSDRSIRRCAVLLHEECPRGENNFYECEGAQAEKPTLVRETEAKPAHKRPCTCGQWMAFVFCKQCGEPLCEDCLDHGVCAGCAEAGKGAPPTLPDEDERMRERAEESRTQERSLTHDPYLAAFTSPIREKTCDCGAPVGGRCRYCLDPACKKHLNEDGICVDCARLCQYMDAADKEVR